MQSRGRFVVMTSLEYVFAIVISMLFSHFVGAISPSALSTISLGNSAFSVLSGVLSMLSTGASILCARLFGAKDPEEAGHITEQTLLLGNVTSIVFTVLCLAFATPIMHVLLPSVEEDVFQEALSFFRVLMLSLPVTVFATILTGILRAAGDWKSPMLITFATNALLFAFAYLCLKVLSLGGVGAALTYLFTRIVTAVMVLVITLKFNNRFHIRMRNLLKPHYPSFSRILRIGAPVAIESLFVQIGYLVANTMIMGLGTTEAAIYNVGNTLYSFPAVIQSITIAIATPIVGQFIGAKDYKNARKVGWRIFRVGMEVSLALCAIIWLNVSRCASFFSSDPTVIAGVGRMMLPIVCVIVPAVQLNSLDPQLRVGGDAKYVMIVAVIGVWVFRLPLTYFMCYRWNMGAAGVFWANAIALGFRAAMNLPRFIKGKYLTMRV